MKRVYMGVDVDCWLRGGCGGPLRVDFREPGMEGVPYLRHSIEKTS